ncbi:uncharacterized protein B0H18DRAFT_998295 [Fomitopsis serialis]|uniref:uncharacterized protein n=1 Tax=Fomitopsis serialis TaxID=139415 RepID=UPI0020087A62|nr:uncharacterized protein B0H18DRAFT_998295 [Neoantrodia serialis]KAH9929222.1 hypothetical protein B0H18DRAFT_998295 [Neoantrodia serialis]
MIFSLVPFATNILNLSTVGVTPAPPPRNCVVTRGAITPLLYKLEIAARVSAMLADAVVLLATWKVTGGVRKLARGVDIDISMTRLLLRDGTLYFLALLLMNFLVLALNVSPISFAGSNVAMLSDVATTILLSRLFLNLREAALAPSMTSSTSHVSDLHFSQVLGPLGNSIDDGPDNEPELDKDDSDAPQEVVDSDFELRELGEASGANVASP